MTSCCWRGRGTRHTRCEARRTSPATSSRSCATHSRPGERRAAPGRCAGVLDVERVAAALGRGAAGAHGNGTADTSVRGRWVGADRALRAVATDSRTVEDGDLFVALDGEKFDGHDFLAAAVKRGASAVVVSRPERAADSECGLVEDTTTALGELARFRRRAWGKPLVAIAGSNGKTSTKELLRAALGSVLEVHANIGQLQQPGGRPAHTCSRSLTPQTSRSWRWNERTGRTRRTSCHRRARHRSRDLDWRGAPRGIWRHRWSPGRRGRSVSRCRSAVVPTDEKALETLAGPRSAQVVTAGLGEGDVRDHLARRPRRVRRARNRWGACACTAPGPAQSP